MIPISDFREVDSGSFAATPGITAVLETRDIHQSFTSVLYRFGKMFKQIRPRVDFTQNSDNVGTRAT